MTRPSHACKAAIDALVQARAHGQRADANACADSITTAAQAYDVQDAVARALNWFQGTPPRCWKSGGPSRGAVLTHAPLPPTGVWASPATTAWPFALRGIEAEIALRLARPVDATLAASLNAGSATALIDAMAVSIEIVDSRWAQGGAAPDLFKLADMQSHGALVLGEWVPYTPARDWSAQTCQVHINSAEHRFLGTHSLADPAFVLPAWLQHATQHGQVLAEGSVVTTGTWCGVLLAQPGDSVRVHFDGIGEAAVRFSA